MVEPGPNFSVSDVHKGWVGALAGLGCNVGNLNFSDRLSFYQTAGQIKDGEFVRHVDDSGAVKMAAKGIETVCYEFWPDVVVITSGFYVPVDTLQILRARGHKVVMLHTESPYEDDRQLERAAHVSLNVLNDPTNIDRFREIGPTVYIPHAYDPAVHHPGPVRYPDDESDFCLVGTGYPSRIEFLEAVDWTGLDVALGGNWGKLAEGSPLRKFLAHDIEHCIENSEAVELYRATKASVNLYRREAQSDDLVEGWSMGPREVELAACGTFFLRESRGEGDEVLSMLPTFDGPDDFSEQLRWWLANDDARSEVARAARAAIADRTFTNNAKRLLAAVEAL
jgi:glycosyltransferase involved in cell wall biosynthesis